MLIIDAPAAPLVADEQLSELRSTSAARRLVHPSRGRVLAAVLRAIADRLDGRLSAQPA